MSENIISENSGMTSVEESKAVQNEKLTREAVVEKLRAMLTADSYEKADIDQLKQAFYRVPRNENKEGESLQPDALEEELKQVLAQMKEKFQQQQKAKQETEKANLEAKLSIIEKLKAVVAQIDMTENVNALIGDIRTWQQEWKGIGAIPATKVAEINKMYQKLIENFYDFVKINNDLREYDFKKNLEAKTALCEKAEALATSDDVVMAVKTLQNLHEEWAQIGPVERDLREPLWLRFKEASSLINKRHQAYFETRKEQELKNEEAKTSLCEKVENLDCSSYKTSKDWEQATQFVQQIQEEWKTIGFAPKKSKVFERFKEATSAFFHKKNEYFKQIKNDLNQNLQLKTKLCEKAEALKDSTDWAKTSDRLIKLQKEWKAIGAVPHKHSDEIWKRFSSACDEFFSHKEQVGKSQKEAENKNLEQKLALIAEIKALTIENADELSAALKDKIAAWNAIGHVPASKRDGVYDEFHKALDEQFKRLRMDNQNRHLQMFRLQVDSLSAEREFEKLFHKTQRELDKLKSDIIGYENNFAFFSFDSKNADSLKKDIEKKVEKLKTEKELAEKKIKILREKLKN